MGWANRVTVLRALLMLALWAVILAGAPSPPPDAWWVAFALFVVTAVTDAVDGVLARRLGDVTVFGRIADPLVDKLLILGTMVSLLGTAGMADVLPPLAVLVVLFRELLVTALRGAVEGRGRSFQAVALGKAKMLLQSVAVGAVLLHGAGLPLARWEVAPLRGLGGAFGHGSLACVLVWAAALVTLVSGADYARRAARLLRAA